MRAVEDARRKVHHDESWLGNLVDQINVLAELRSQQGDFRKAESLYREVLQRIHDMRKPDMDLAIGIYSMMAALYERWERHDDAATCYQKALELTHKQNGRVSDNTATLKNNLGLIYKNRGDREKAALFYEEALDEFLQVHGEQNHRVASVYDNLGVLYYQNLEVERAQETHLKALKIRMKLPQNEVNDLELAQTYKNLAAVFKALGDFQQAFECTEHAKAVIARNGNGMTSSASSAEKKSGTGMLMDHVND